MAFLSDLKTWWNYGPKAVFAGGSPARNLAQNVTYAGTKINAPELGLGELAGVTGKWGEKIVKPAYAAEDDGGWTGSYGVMPPGSGTGNFLSGGNGGGGGDGGDTRLQELEKVGAGRNPSQEEEYQALLSQMTNTANAQREADISQINTTFDQADAASNRNLSEIGSQYETAKTGLSGAIEGVKTQVGNAMTSAKENTQYQVNKALSTAKDVVKQNRNALRALGILASTAAGELLQKPMTQFGQQAYEMGVSLTNRIKELDDYLTQKTDEHVNLLKELEDNYMSLVGKIQDDLRFNARQRADAIAAANTALQAKITDIAGSVMQYKQTVETNKMNLAQSIAQLMLYQNPEADVSGILASAVQTAGNMMSPQTAAMTTEKKRLYQ